MRVPHHRRTIPPRYIKSSGGRMSPPRLPLLVLLFVGCLVYEIGSYTIHHAAPVALAVFLYLGLAAITRR